MRVWDIHPGYLSRQGLLGQHAEIHALFSVIRGQGKGYANHPETLRWQGHEGVLAARHLLTVQEMTLRGFNHASPVSIRPENGTPPYVDRPSRQFELLRQKNRRKGHEGRIPLPVNGSQFWAHYKYSVMARNYKYYQEVKEFLRRRRPNPIEKEDDLIELVFCYMNRGASEKSLRNVVDHLWGYIKDVISPEEKSAFLSSQKEGLPLEFMYGLAKKYNRTYLLHSTIFADFLSLDGAPPTRAHF